MPKVPVDESNFGGLPSVQVDESNLGDFEALLAEAALTTEIDAEAACTDFRILGVDFVSRDADVLQGYFVPGARGYDCPGDSASIFVRVRGGKVTGRVYQCGDCEQLLDQEEFDRAVERYRGQTVPRLVPQVADGRWNVRSYENESWP